MKQYYIISNGVQLGPYTKEELGLQNLTPSTPVWREGLSEWVEASTLPELAEVLQSASVNPSYENPQKGQYPDFNNTPNPQPPYGQPQQPYGQPTYGQPQQPYGQPGQQPYGQPPYGYNPFPVPHTNWMPWAIITTIISGCTTCVGLILGIISIVYASKANSLYASGLQAEGDAANSTARTLTIINIVLLIIGIIGNIAYFAFIGGYILPYLQ